MSLPRRDFLQRCSLASTLLILPRGLRAGAATPPNSRLQIALVGVGGRGRTALAALQSEQIVAFCDVDFARGRDAILKDGKSRGLLGRFSGARWFHDYREMFEQMGDAIDAVAIAVPDHMHFPIALAALRRRKHVFVEKPLCRSVSEVRALHAAARTAGVVTQMGNQGRASEGIRLTREWVQAGVIGRVHTVHAWTHRKGRSYSYPLEELTAPSPPPPVTLQYDLWLGATPHRPYHALRGHGSWRGCPDFGSGVLGDWGCHQLDAANFALDLGAPTVIEAASTPPKSDTFPETNTVNWLFPARGDRGPVRVQWFDGGLLPPEPVPGFKFDANGGSLLYGDKGILWVGSHSATARLLPEARMQAMRDALPPKSIPRIKGSPHNEWIDAIRCGTRCGSDFDYAAPLAETVLLGVAAVRTRGRIEWDAAAGRVTNNNAANHFIGPGYTYRSGWGV